MCNPDELEARIEDIEILLGEVVEDSHDNYIRNASTLAQIHNIYHTLGVLTAVDIEKERNELRAMYNFTEKDPA